MKKLILLMLLIAPLSALAQDDDIPFCELFVPSTTDSRSVAMGRSSLMSAAGSNAVFYNPAQLAAQSESYMLAGGRMFAGMFDEMIEGEEYFGTYDPHFRLDHLSVSVPYQIKYTKVKLGFGLGYQVYYDWGRKASSDDYGLTGRMDGGLSTLSPAVSIGFADKIFVGIAYNRSISSNINEDVTWEWEEEWTPEDVNMEVESSGSFFTLSTLARVTPSLSIGLRYRPTFDWEWKAKEGTEDFPYQGQKATLKVPALLGLGASVDLLNRFTLVGQYETRPFSGFDVGADQNVFGIDDGFNLRFGAEIKSSKVPVRFGVFRDAILACNAEDTAPRSLQGLTAGIGFRLGVVVLDTAVEVARWSEDEGGGDVYRETLLRLHTSLGARF